MINKKIRKKYIITGVILMIMLVFMACSGDETVIDSFGNTAECEAAKNEAGYDVSSSEAKYDASKTGAQYDASKNETDSKADNETDNETDNEADTMSDGFESADMNPDDKLIYVHVCGAVCNPGVVALPEGSRAEYALELAGGFDEGANTVYVNLAAEVTDGQRLYFPYLDDKLNPELGMQDEKADGNSASGTTGSAYPVNINTADVTGLCTIPGIGVTRANSIIEYRNAYGPFERIEDIKKVSGIGEASYSKMSAYICVK